jgi:peptidylglycine monooxygenase
MIAPQVVILGQRRYRVERDWARWPDAVQRGFFSQVAVDSRGHVFLLQRGATPVVQFDPDGSFVAAWGDEMIADGHGIYIDAADRLFIVDRDAHQVIVADTSGEELMRLGQRHDPHDGAPFNHPTHASVAPDGEIYVSDGYGNTNLHRFGADGRHLGTFGSAGDGPGQFSTPHSNWAGRSQVLVADRENDRVQVFDRAGGAVGEWRGLYHPMAIWQDADGITIVSDQTPRLVAYDADGHIVGRCRGAINGAHGLFGDAAGNLFLSELPPGGITRLARIN